MPQNPIITPNTQCDTCGKAFRKIPSAIHKHNFCSMKCFKQWLGIYWKEYPRGPEWKAKLRGQLRTPETRRKIAEVKHQWHIKNKDTPKYEEYRKKKREEANERWLKIHADPKLMEQHSESMRVIKNEDIPNILEQLKTTSKKQLAKDLGITRCALISNLRVRNIPRENKPVRYEPNLEPNYHLGYVLGTIFGDGYCFKQNGTTTYVIGLGSTDREFAQYFSIQLCKVLRREKPMCIKKNKIVTKNNIVRKAYHVTCLRSKKLGLFIKSVDMIALEQIISTNQDCKIGFLRGFFDSEGCITLSQFNAHNCRTRRLTIDISNTNKCLLEITKRSLADLNIKSFNVGQMKVKVNGWNKKTLYHLRLSQSKGDTMRFIQKIGTRINRKKAKLREWQYHIMPFIRHLTQAEPINNGINMEIML